MTSNRTRAGGALLILALVAAVQLHEGAWHADLASHPDEAAHFTTGVMVLDYLRTALGSSPMAFAEEYYAHYPKVAFGHWPPAFYVIQAVWYALFGVSSTAAMALVGCVAALAIAIFAWRIHLLHGPWIAVTSILMAFALPLVRESMVMVLSDMLAVLFTLLALFALADACARPSVRSWAGFWGWTLVAILTKSSTLPLAIVAPLVALWLWRGLRSRWMMAGVAAGLVLAAAGALGLILPFRGGAMFAVNWLQRLPSLGALFDAIPWPVGLIAAVGLLPRSGVAAERTTLVRILLLFVAVSLPAQLFARDVVEARYFLPVLMAILLLFAEGLHRIHAALPRADARGAAALRLVLGLGLLLLTIQATPAFSLQWRRGYREVARAIPPRSVVLISADSSGEGAFVAARRAESGAAPLARSGFVLRVSKLLLRSDWMGRDYEPLVSTVEELREVLDASRTRFVVLDKTGFESLLTRPQHRLLLAAVQDTRRFRLAGEFPVTSPGVRWGNAIAVYENLLLPENPSATIRLDLSHNLGRSLEVRIPAELDDPAARMTPPPPALANVAPVFRIEPAEDQAGWTGGEGKAYVAGPPRTPWTVEGIPSWIRVTGTRGALTYRVEPNHAQERRTAVLRLGGQPFPVRQARSPYIPIPFTEQFTDWQDRWVLAQLGEAALLRPGPRAPSGGGTALVEKARADGEPYLTQLYLPFVQVEPGRRHRLSFWIKTERAAELEVVLSTKRPPHAFCGFAEKFSTSAAWTRFSFPFQSAGQGCTVETNRLSFLLGRLAGRLWLADLAIVPE